MNKIGRYRVVKELGRGAMGVVYLAIDPNIGRDVAIKTIRLREVEKPEERERLRERLFREARSAGILSHPGIVTIYDVDEEDGLAYIAMEYVNGPTLDYLLSQDEPIAPGQMFSVLGQTAAALDYAHSKGIVHRDIKPANIMIAADGEGDRFRNREGQHQRTPHDHRHHRGDAALHVAGAGARAGSGRALGPIFAGGDRLRDADGRKTVHGRASHHRGVQDCRRGAAGAAPAEHDDRGGDRGRAAQGDVEESRGAVRHLPGVYVGAGKRLRHHAGMEADAARRQPERADGGGSRTRDSGRAAGAAPLAPCRNDSRARALQRSEFLGVPDGDSGGGGAAGVTRLAGRAMDREESESAGRNQAKRHEE